MFEEKLLLTIHEAARALSLSVWTLRHWIHIKKIRCVRAGRRVMIEPSELERLLNAGRDPARVEELEKEKLAELR